MQPDEDRRRKTYQGIARARLLLKRDLGWLPGFPRVEADSALRNASDEHTLLGRDQLAAHWPPASRAIRSCPRVEDGAGGRAFELGKGKECGDESLHSKGPVQIWIYCQIKQKCYIWLHE
jgi:hypothetical protein